MCFCAFRTDSSKTRGVFHSICCRFLLAAIYYILLEWPAGSAAMESRWPVVRIPDSEAGREAADYFGGRRVCACKSNVPDVALGVSVPSDSPV